MGRKAVNKARKEDKAKKKIWSKTLFSHLQETGLQKLSINQIAKHLAVSKSTIYEYFDSKEELILLATHSKIEELLPALQLLKEKEQGFAERYWLFFNYITDKCSGISARFLRDLQQHYPEAWQTVAGFLNILMQTISSFYQQGMEAGVFRKGNIALLLEQDRHFMFSILTDDAFLQQHQLNLDQVIRDYLEFKFYGLKLE